MLGMLNKCLELETTNQHGHSAFACARLTACGRSRATPVVIVSRFESLVFRMLTELGRMQVLDRSAQGTRRHQREMG